MTDRSADITEAAAEIDEAAHAGLVPQLTMMVKALLASPVRTRLFWLAGAIFLVIVLTAYGQIQLNAWNQPFYDALARRDLKEFIEQLGVFAIIAGALLVLNVAQRWLNEMTKLKLRQGLVYDLVGQWLEPKRAFRLANAGPMGVNPDQRMHDDARHLTELSTDLGIGLLQATILLVTFVDVLWELSAGFVFHYDGWSFSIPGYMVWAAVIYAGSASLLSYWVGHRLVVQNSERYAREADLRFSLMRVNEHIDAIALAGGEADEARRIGIDLKGVLVAMRTLVSGLTRLTWITSGYGWFTLVAPILVAAPVYFSGNISFGGMMVAVGAFNQVQTSLRWFVDNFSSIADWRATLLRVASFRRAVITTDRMHKVESRIEVEDGPAGKITIDNLEISSPQGCTMLKEKEVTIEAGDRVAVVGEPGVGKTLLFRALAGLWPWGTGRIVRPPNERIYYMPRSAYLPPGTLRDVLAYPRKVKSFPEDGFATALARFGLERLVPMLDTSKRWDRELNEAEQQKLAFSRLLLHDPPWALMDELLESLDDLTRQRVLDVMANELKGMGIVHIGMVDGLEQVFPRVLHLIKDPRARRLTRSKADRATPAPSAIQLANSLAKHDS